MDDVISLLTISRPTFYDIFKDTDGLDDIKACLDQNKISRKVKLRQKWANSDNATLNIALYKLCSAPDERALLADRTVNKNDSTHKIEQMPTITVDGEEFIPNIGKEPEKYNQENQ